MRNVALKSMDSASPRISGRVATEAAELGLVFEEVVDGVMEMNVLR